MGELAERIDCLGCGKPSPRPWHAWCWLKAIPRYRIRRAFRGAWCRIKGGHYYSKHEWGTGLDGTVDLYCGSCGGFIENRPMDDLPREVANHISDVLGGV